ncbi:MAG: hypothetical protein IID43_01860 [Planctomycetes bacterium]|nr:hypothetical protein [Planctomycetota bacterium]
MSHKRKRLYIALMVLAAAGFGVDRFVFSRSSTAPSVAMASSGVAAASVFPNISGNTDAALAIPELPFPRAVEGYSFGDDIQDIFTPPGWEPNGSTKSGNRFRAARDSGPSGRAEFMRSHELGGILFHDNLKIAVLDGRWMRVGEMIDGCTLKNVSGSQVLFECYDGKAELTFGRESSAHEPRRD